MHVAPRRTLKPWRDVMTMSLCPQSLTRTNFAASIESDLMTRHVTHFTFLGLFLCLHCARMILRRVTPVSQVTSCEWLCDGAFLATGSKDTDVRFWSMHERGASGVYVLDVVHTYVRSHKSYYPRNKQTKNVFIKHLLKF